MSKFQENLRTDKRTEGHTLLKSQIKHSLTTLNIAIAICWK